MSDWWGVRARTGASWYAVVIYSGSLCRADSTTFFHLRPLAAVATALLEGPQRNTRHELTSSA